MLIVVPTTVLALLLGFGALRQLSVGIQGGQAEPFWMGAIGALVCFLLIAAAVALWRRWNGARAFAISAGLTFIAFHVYASVPPHRSVGVGVALAACAYGLGFLVFALRHHENRQAV
jgi:hypothetical protein